MPTRKQRQPVADAATGADANSDTPTPSHARVSSPRRTTRPLTDEERAAAQETFLVAFARSANVSQSAKRAHISRDTVYEWLARDEPFRTRYEHADADAQDVLRKEAFRRAVVGVNEPLTNGQGLIYEMEVVLGKDGEPALDDRGRPKLRRGKIATVKKYSDGLLQTMLKARVPEYRDKKQVEVSGPNGGPIATQVTNEQVLTINLEGMSVAQLRALRAALHTGAADDVAGERDGDSSNLPYSGG